MRIARQTKAVVLLALVIFASHTEPSSAKIVQEPPKKDGQAAKEKKVELFAQLGHSKYLLSYAFSPDGKYLVTVGVDGTRLWEVTTGEELWAHHFLGEVFFSPDGKYLVSESLDGTRLLRELETFDAVREFQGPTEDREYFVRAELSPDGKYLLKFDNKRVQVEEVETGREVSRFEFVYDLRGFSPDGKYLLELSQLNALPVSQLGRPPDDGTVRLWEVETGRGRRFRSNSAVVLVAFSQDGGSLLTAGDYSARKWELETGRLERQVQLGHKEWWRSDHAFSPDGRYFLILEEHSSDIAPEDKGLMLLWKMETGRQLRRHSVDQAAFSPDSKYFLTIEYDDKARLWEVETGHLVRQLSANYDHQAIRWIAFSPDGRYFVTAEDDILRMWDVVTGREVRQYQANAVEKAAFSFSPDGKYFLTIADDNKVRLWEVETGHQVRHFEIPKASLASDGRLNFFDRKYALLFEAKGIGGIFSITIGSITRLLDVETGLEVLQVPNPCPSAYTCAFSPDGKYSLSSGFLSGDAHLLDVSTGKELCQLISFDDGNWVVVDPEGRFDTGNLEEIKGLNWRIPDDPLHLLPLEIFTRDYYEPRLLPRILSGEVFKPVSKILDLNRVQPAVEIAAVERDRDHPDRINVSVKVARASSSSQKDAAGRPLATGVYDLRLFRDGQIVAQIPEPASQIATNDRGLIEWRNRNRVRLDADGMTTITFRDIKLPRQVDAKQVELTAYAFNEDRVRSKTAHHTFELPADLPPIKGRAYVIAVGVNVFEEPAFNLNFSVNDARSVLQTLGKGLVAGSIYEEVVQVPLISDCQLQPGDIQATKANFKAVIDLLAGRKPDFESLKAIPTELAAKLREARPEDMVLISLSTHGYADSDGNFYCVLSDTGKVGDRKVSEELLKRMAPRFVSSEELSLWLRDVDAGEMLMIVDACHSAALAGREFKPGPMGSRGLGQLSYDKGMRILTATQADNVALGSGALRQGLLTYALVRDGLEKGKADYAPADGKVSVKEWLQFGEQQVPRLYEQIKKGEMKELVQPRATAKSRSCVADKRFNVKELTTSKVKVQKPSLFDFSRAKRDTLLFNLGNK